MVNLTDPDRIDLWSLKKTELVEKPLAEIGEHWQMVNDPRHIIAETYEYLSYKVLTKAIDWLEYNRLVTAYKDVTASHDIYEFSIQTLAKAGYIF